LAGCVFFLVALEGDFLGFVGLVRDGRRSSREHGRRSNRRVGSRLGRVLRWLLRLADGGFVLGGRGRRGVLARCVLVIFGVVAFVVVCFGGVRVGVFRGVRVFFAVVGGDLDGDLGVAVPEVEAVLVFALGGLVADDAAVVEDVRRVRLQRVARVQVLDREPHRRALARRRRRAHRRCVFFLRRLGSCGVLFLRSLVVCGGLVVPWLVFVLVVFGRRRRVVLVLGAVLRLVLLLFLLLLGTLVLFVLGLLLLLLLLRRRRRRRDHRRPPRRQRQLHAPGHCLLRVFVCRHCLGVVVHDERFFGLLFRRGNGDVFSGGRVDEGLFVGDDGRFVSSLEGDFHLGLVRDGRRRSREHGRHPRVRPTERRRPLLRRLFFGLRVVSSQRQQIFRGSSRHRFFFRRRRHEEEALFFSAFFGVADLVLFLLCFVALVGVVVVAALALVALVALFLGGRSQRSSSGVGGGLLFGGLELLGEVLLFEDRQQVVDVVVEAHVVLVVGPRLELVGELDHADVVVGVAGRSGSGPANDGELLGVAFRVHRLPRDRKQHRQGLVRLVALDDVPRAHADDAEAHLGHLFKNALHVVSGFRARPRAVSRGLVQKLRRNLRRTSRRAFPSQRDRLTAF